MIIYQDEGLIIGDMDKWDCEKRVYYIESDIQKGQSTFQKALEPHEGKRVRMTVEVL